MTRSDLYVVVAVALAVFGITAFAPAVLADGDSWWHVKAGQWILANGAIPDTDPFSTWQAGRPWVAHEWLSEVLMARAFRLAGWSGVVLLTALAASLAFALLGLRLARDLGGLALGCCLALVAALAAAGLLARPHILALPVLVAWTIGLLSARDHDRAPSLLLLPLMALWANLHGGYAFGIALIGPFALEALLAAPVAGRWRVVRSWGLFGCGAVVASVVTPHGIEGLLFPLQLLQLKSLSLIGEWQPASFGTLKPLEIALLALLYVAMRFPLKVAPLRLLLLLGLVHMALSQGRHELLLGVVGMLVLAGPLAKALGLGAEPGENVRRPGARTGLPIAAALLAALCLVGLRVALPVVRSDGPAAPITAMAAVPDALRRQPVLNAYAFGGYLIWLGIQPSIDGRADMYGDAYMFAHQAMDAAEPAAVEAMLASSRAQWTIFPPNTPMVALLDARPGWRRLHADAFAVVHGKGAGG